MKLKLSYLDPKTLQPHPLNPRRHDDRQRLAVTRMLERFGWVVPAIWNARTQRLIDGHLRRQIVLDGLDEKIPVIVVDWDEADEASFMLGLGRTQELAEWRDDFLREYLTDRQGDWPPGWTDEDWQRLTSTDTSFLDRFEAEADDTAGTGDDEPTSAALPAGYGKLLFMMMPDDRDRLFECLNRLQREHGLTTKADALITLVERSNAEH